MKKTLALPLCITALGIVGLAHLGGCDSETIQTTTSTTSSAGGGGSGAQGGGGQGGGGTGGSGGTVLTGKDECPGDPYAIDIGTVLTLHGDTSTAMDDYQSLCGDDPPGSGPDLVYELTVAAAGTLSVTYQSLSMGFDPVMYLRTDCADDATVMWCRDFSSTQRVNKLHVTAGTYYLILDGAAQTSGEFDLFLTFQAPMCGDGALNPGEQCDDGNAAGGDGCDACMLEPGSFEDCTDPDPQTIDPGHTVLIGTTVGNVNNHTYDEADCTIGGVPPGPNDTGGVDRVYALTPSTSGTMTIVLGLDEAGTTAYCDISIVDPGCWDRVLHVRHVDGAQGPAICQDQEDISNPDSAQWIPPSAATQIACDGFGTVPNGYTQTVTFPVTSGEVYYVFVDSFYVGPTAQGIYNLHIDLN